MEYSPDHISESVIRSVPELPAEVTKGNVLWIELNGLADVNLLKALGERFNLHPLALEDVLNVGQRPKFETYENHLFIIAQMIYNEGAETLCGEQVSIFVGENVLISIQEDHETDVFEPVRQRIRVGGGYVRKMGPDYLAYALLDAIVDHCFPVLEIIGEALEEMENEVLNKPNPRTVGTVHNFKRTLMQLRRFVWPERDVVSAMLHSDSQVIRKETRIFLRDLYDHTVQIMDLIEAYREVTTGLFEMYLSSVSLRTNEIMRVLTVISAIFIPLTFIVGLYGMNFQPTTTTGDAAPANMPELHWKYGYPLVLGVMALIAAGQIYFFKRKKWM
ncbi:MAG: magnesium/cobalt transporter CorA [Verrucomicrobiota bacterium]